MKLIDLTLEDVLLEKASELTGIVDQTTLLNAALSALITLESNSKYASEIHRYVEIELADIKTGQNKISTQKICY